MRVKVIWLCGLLAACTSGAVTVPRGRRRLRGAAGAAPPRPPAVGDFTTTIEGALAEPTADGLPAHYPGARLPSADGTGPALDDDQHQPDAVDARAAEDRRRRRRSSSSTRRAASSSWCSPARCRTASTASTSRSTPSRAPTPVGERRFDRSVGARVAGVGSCGRYRDPDAAQRAFLAAGGPQADRLRPRPRRRRLRLQLRPRPLPRAPLSRGVQPRPVAGRQHRAHARGVTAATAAVGIDARAPARSRRSPSAARRRRSAGRTRRRIAKMRPRAAPPAPPARAAPGARRAGRRSIAGAFGGAVPAARPQASAKAARLGPAALEAGPVPGGQRRRLVEKEDLAVAVAPDRRAAGRGTRSGRRSTPGCASAPRPSVAVRPVQPPAAVAHQRARAPRRRAALPSGAQRFCERRRPVHPPRSAHGDSRAVQPELRPAPRRAAPRSSSCCTTPRWRPPRRRSTGSATRRPRSRRTT